MDFTRCRIRYFFNFVLEKSQRGCWLKLRQLDSCVFILCNVIDNMCWWQWWWFQFFIDPNTNCFMPVFLQILVSSHSGIQSHFPHFNHALVCENSDFSTCLIEQHGFLIRKSILFRIIIGRVVQVHVVFDVSAPWLRLGPLVEDEWKLGWIDEVAQRSLEIHLCLNIVCIALSNVDGERSWVECLARQVRLEARH